jgi:hypothetical protein
MKYATTLPKGVKLKIVIILRCCLLPNFALALRGSIFFTKTAPTRQISVITGLGE